MVLVAAVTLLRTKELVSRWRSRKEARWQLFPRKEQSREQPEGALQKGVWTAYLVIRLREVLMRRDVYPDLGIGQKLTSTNAPSASSFSRLQG